MSYIFACLVPPLTLFHDLFMFVSFTRTSSASAEVPLSVARGFPSPSPPGLRDRHLCAAGWPRSPRFHGSQDARHRRMAESYRVHTGSGLTVEQIWSFLGEVFQNSNIPNFQLNICEFLRFSPFRPPSPKHC